MSATGRLCALIKCFGIKPWFASRLVSIQIANAKTIMSATTEKMKKDAFSIFQEGVNSVLPDRLFKESFQVKKDSIVAGNKSYPLNHNVYVAGFGKAVYGMAQELEKVLKDHIVNGIISVPIGTLEESEHKKQGPLVYMEGAKDNLPDEASFLSASKIIDMVSDLKDTDILIVLISGGGSALLPAPIPPLNLFEKQMIIKMLSDKGATIQELNSVRKRLSRLKGGGLAEMAWPAKVLSFILSDVINDPLDVIASGPTVKNEDDRRLVFDIFTKYGATEEVFPNSFAVCRQKSTTEIPFSSHVNNILIGNNTKAINSALNKATSLGYIAFPLTFSLQGEANIVGSKLAVLANHLLLRMHSKSYPTSTNSLESANDLFLNIDVLNTLLIQTSNMKIDNLCLICGGETVVKVTGKGIGGRNQELALAAAVELNSIFVDQKVPGGEIVLLSAGTDGIDGPTEAAGAFAYPTLVYLAKNQGLDPMKFLHNNNSYNFFQNFNNSQDLLVTGHTGTNVMDLQIILIKK